MTSRSVGKTQVAKGFARPASRLPPLGLVFLFCLLFRILNAFLLQTYFNPDEYWQGSEVAYQLVFGKGRLTWEWQEGAQIRGFAHPFLFAGIFKLLLFAGWDSRLAVAWAPFLVQSLLAALGDLYLLRLAHKLSGGNYRFARLVLLQQLFNWFTLYCAPRVLSNSAEAALTTVALFYWPLLSGEAAAARGSRLWLPLALAACTVALRPTAALLWGVLGLFLLADVVRNSWGPSSGAAVSPATPWARAARGVAGVLCQVACVGLAWFLLTSWVDGLAYSHTAGHVTAAPVAFAPPEGSPVHPFSAWLARHGLVFAPWNFLRFNVLTGGSELYGTHPGAWYFYAGLPAMLGPQLPIVALGLWHSFRRRSPTATQSASSTGSIDLKPTRVPPGTARHSTEITPGAYPRRRRVISLQGSQSAAHPSLESRSRAAELSGAQDDLWLPRCVSRRLLWCILAPLCFYSLNPHKEFRFVFPVLPLCMMFAAVGWSRLFGLAEHSRPLPLVRSSHRRRLLQAGVVASSLAAFAYLALAHQRAPIATAFVLADLIQERKSTVTADPTGTFASPPRETSLLWLCGCHSAPAYSLLHFPAGRSGVDLHVEHLDCSPQPLPHQPKAAAPVPPGHAFDLATDRRTALLTLAGTETNLFERRPDVFAQTLFGSLSGGFNRSEADEDQSLGIAHENDDGAGSYTDELRRLLHLPGRGLVRRLRARLPDFVVIYASAEAHVAPVLRSFGYEEPPGGRGKVWHSHLGDTSHFLVYARHP